MFGIRNRKRIEQLEGIIEHFVDIKKEAVLIEAYNDNWEIIDEARIKETYTLKTSALPAELNQVINNHAGCINDVQDVVEDIDDQVDIHADVIELMSNEIWPPIADDEIKKKAKREAMKKAKKTK